MGDNLKRRIKIGGITRIIHIVISAILSIITFLDSSSTGNILLWNIFVLNAPVLFDFLHDYYCVPQEKTGRTFRIFSIIILSILGLSFIAAILYVGVDYGIKNKGDLVQHLIAIILSFEHFSILCNPLGVFWGYICTILKEEHRIEKGECNNETGGDIA